MRFQIAFAKSLAAGLASVTGLASQMRVVFECRDFLLKFCAAFVLVATATSETLQCWHTCKAHVSVISLCDLISAVVFELVAQRTRYGFHA